MPPNFIIRTNDDCPNLCGIGGAFSSVSELKEALMDVIKVYNKGHAKPFKWTKDASGLG
jgi:hypothetical protein